MQTQLRDMEYFAAIAEHGQVQRAAAALGLSQPALSKSLRRLEETMKAKLLKRTPKGVELTAVGSALLSQVRRLRLTLDEISRETADLSEGRAGYLRVGTGPDLAMHLMPAACAALLKDAARVTLKVTVGTADVLLPALSRGELDLLVTASPLIGHDDLVLERLIDEDYVVYASANHRLARKKRVTLADLAQERWMLALTSGSLQQELHRAFAANGLPPPKVTVETNSVPFRLHLLPSTDLLTFLPKRAFHERTAGARLAALHVNGLSYRRTIAVCHRKDAYLSPAAGRFVEILKTTAMEIATP